MGHHLVRLAIALFADMHRRT